MDKEQEHSQAVGSLNVLLVARGSKELGQCWAVRANFKTFWEAEQTYS